MNSTAKRKTESAVRGAQRVAVAALLLSVFSMLAFGQASVNESAETASVYVNGSTGSDSNPGTQTRPVKTIRKGASLAVSNNWRGIGTRVVILAGTYREAITLGISTKDTSAPMTFQASTAGTVIVSGAEVWAGWATYGPKPAIFTHTWPYRWGLCPQATSGPLMQNIVRRREMIFVNRTPLTQVLSFMEMLEGTFYVDEARGTVYIWPPAGTSMATARVEVAVRPTLWQVLGRKNMVVRGMSFEYANSCHQDQAVVFTYKSKNILVDNDKFIWNNSGGLGFAQATDFTIKNSVANHNGEVGLTSYEVKYGLWESDQASYNNWRGAQGAFYAWSAGGAKFMLTHDSTFRNVSTNYNPSPGIHWDTDNENITADSLVSAHNFRYALGVEKSQGPLSISNSSLCTSNREGNLFGGGALLRNSPHVKLTGNSLSNNVTGQIIIVGKGGGLPVTNWETGQVLNLITENTSILQNTIEGSGSQQVFEDSYLSGTDWALFSGSLISDYNTWWNPNKSKPFTVPIPKEKTLLDFAGWKVLTGKDVHSQYKELSVVPAACQVSPDSPDFWLMVDNTSRTTSPGGSVTFKFTSFPNGFTGTVQLNVTGVSAMRGSSAWTPGASISLGSTPVTVALQIHTTSSTPLGTYIVTVHAHHGSLTRTSAVWVVVN